MTYPVLKYPDYVTPHGVYEIIAGRIPDVTLTATDGSVEFYLQGGRSIADHINPESVRLKDAKGLASTFQAIIQKGSSQDGVTFVTALADPLMPELVVEARGADPARCRQVVTDLYASLDPINTSTLSFFTFAQGRWWGKVRFIKPPDEPIERIQTPRQQLTLKLQIDEGFWKSYDDVYQFDFGYDLVRDEFSIDYPEDLGPNYPQAYTGTGSGYCHTRNGQAVWHDDPDTLFFTGTRRVVAGPYAAYSAPADNHDVEIVINNTPEFTSGSGAANDIWGRMGRNLDGTWNGTGIRARVGWGYLLISSFVNFEETTIAQDLTIIPPLTNDSWKLRCGQTGNNRYFAILRNGTVVLSATESGTTSLIGSSYRGVGFGMQGGSAVITQATPAQVKKVDSGTMTDTFSTAHTVGLDTAWPLYYTGRNDAYIHTRLGLAEWVDNSGTDTQSVVNGPYKDFSTATDDQVIRMLFGSFQEWSFPDSGANTLWGRMGRNDDGTWDGNGICMQIALNQLTVSAHVSHTKIWTRTVDLILPPAPNDSFKLLCGGSSPRQFRVMKNSITVMDFKESGTSSMMGPDYRGVGFGMVAGAALETQATPAAIHQISAGDNSNVTQSGYLYRTNIGDQPMFDDYTCFGPGLFRFWNGPDAGADDYVEFGPLLTNQIMQLRTHPGKRNVQDLTVIPPTPQALTSFQKALDQFLSFAYGNNVPPLVQSIVSKFGILPPQGNPYSLLNGRWSDDAAIPPKSPGSPAQTYSVQVQVVGGNADTKIIASGTPRRRYPL